VRCLALALVLASVPGVASAQSTEFPCLDELEEAELEARERYIDERLQAGKTYARVWWYGQITLWAGVVAFQAIQAARSETRNKRFPNAVGLAGAGLTLLQLLVVPMTAAYAPQRYRRMPTETHPQRVARVRYGLESLERAAARQKLGGGLSAHALPLLWSSFWGTYNRRRFDPGPSQMTLIIGGGLLLSELRILSMPRRAIDDWEHARGSICGNVSAPRRTRRTVEDLDAERALDEEIEEEEWDAPVESPGSPDAAGDAEEAEGEEPDTGDSDDVGEDPEGDAAAQPSARVHLGPLGIRVLW